MSVRTNFGCSECERPAVARGLCGRHYRRLMVYGDPKIGMMAMNGEPLAFINAVPLSGEGCVTWPYSKCTNGYGQVAINGKKVLTHRISCERLNGPPPTPQHEAAHSCGNGHLGCVSPWHLRWLTHAENTAESAGSARKKAAGKRLSEQRLAASAARKAAAAENREGRG